MTRRPRLRILVPVVVVALLALFAAVGAVSTWRSDRAATSVERDAGGSVVKTVGGGLDGVAESAPELGGTDQSAVASDDYAALPAAAPFASHHLVRNGTIALIVRDGTLLDSVRRITAMTQGMGGYVMSSMIGTDPSSPYPVEPLAGGADDPAVLGESVVDESPGDAGVKLADPAGRGYASLLVRVPQQSFDDALQRFAQLGKVEDLSTSSEDVTGQFVDLEARLRHYRAVERRLVRFLSETGSIKDMLVIQDRLDQVQLTIEELTAQLKSLRETTSFGTLSVSLREAGATQVAVAGPGNTFGGTFWNSLELLGRGARLCALAVAALLPFAAVAAVVAVVVWYVRRVLRGRRRAAPPAQPA